MNFFKKAAKVSLSRGDTRPNEAPLRRLGWAAGTVLTAGRRRSFFCDTLGSIKLCFWCNIVRLKITDPDSMPWNKAFKLYVWMSKKFPDRGVLIRNYPMSDTYVESEASRISGRKVTVLEKWSCRFNLVRLGDRLTLAELQTCHRIRVAGGVV